MAINVFPEIPGYVIQEKIYETHRTIIFRGVQEQSGLPIVLKTLANDHPSSQEVARFRNSARR